MANRNRVRNGTDGCVRLTPHWATQELTMADSRTRKADLRRMLLRRRGEMQDDVQRVTFSAT